MRPLLVISTLMLAGCATSIADIKASPNHFILDLGAPRAKVADCLGASLDTVKFGFDANRLPNQRVSGDRTSFFLQDVAVFIYLIEIVDQPAGVRVEAWTSPSGVNTPEPGPFIDNLKARAQTCA